MRLFVCAGEASGDRLAADLVAELRSEAAVEARGLPGPAMRAAGVAGVAEAEAVQGIGLVEVARRVPYFARLIDRLAADALRFAPDVVVTVDSPSLLLRLGRRLRGLAPRAHVGAPQVWAWRAGRLHTLRRSTDHVLCLLPFEPPLLRIAGVPATFVGHPAARAYEGHHDPDVVALAPGSRPSEVATLWPVLREVAAAIRLRRPGCRFVVPVSPTARVPDDLDAERVDGVLGARHAAVAITASGTATVEWAAAGVPQVVLYAVRPSTWAIARRLVRVPGIALPNVLADERVVPEFIQHLPVPAIVEAALALTGSAGRAQIAALTPWMRALDADTAASRMAATVRALVEGHR